MTNKIGKKTNKVFLNSYTFILVFIMVTYLSCEIVTVK